MNERLERRAARERAARKEAERLLDEKSRVLSQMNERLEIARLELESRVEERTVELQVARDEARDANAAKSRFMAHLSHELRTPLTAILGFTGELLRASPQSGDLATIDRNARHLLDVINQSLDLSQVESGTLTLYPRATDPRAMVRELEASMAPRAIASELAFRVSVASEVPEHVLLDGLRTRQVLLNLLGNAIKFTTQGVVALRMFVPDSDDPDLLRIDVLDTGRGLSREDSIRIFEPFRQAEHRDRTVGTGLGLAIARQLARAMGGDVTVQSTPGRGSCFTMTLRAPAVDDARAGWTEESVPRVDSGLHGVRMVLAEDAKDSRVLLTRWCVRAGAEVVAVENGALAIEAVDDTIDLVVMDVQMPVLDGLEATRALRERGYSGPIVALTASSMPADRDATLTAGCDVCLTKPIERDRLLEELAELCLPMV